MDSTPQILRCSGGFKLTAITKVLYMF